MASDALCRDGALTKDGKAGLTAFYCGHERSPENSRAVGKYTTCRTCARQRDRNRRRAVPDAERYLAYRIRIVPQQLDAARRKVAALENEARRLGMVDLLEVHHAS